MKKKLRFILFFLLFIFISTAHASYVNTCLLTEKLLSDPKIKITNDEQLIHNRKETTFELSILINDAKKTTDRSDRGCSLSNNKPYLLSINITNAYQLVSAKKDDDIQLIEIIKDSDSRPEIYTSYAIISLTSHK